jgi:hypothetical protein
MKENGEFWRMGKNRSWPLVRPCPSNYVRLVDTSAQKEEEVGCFETSINARHVTRRHIQEHHIYTLLWLNVLLHYLPVSHKVFNDVSGGSIELTNERTNERRAFPVNSVAALCLGRPALISGPDAGWSSSCFTYQSVWGKFWYFSLRQISRATFFGTSSSSLMNHCTFTMFSGLQILLNKSQVPKFNTIFIYVNISVYVYVKDLFKKRPNFCL